MEDGFGRVIAMDGQSAMVGGDPGISVVDDYTQKNVGGWFLTQTIPAEFVSTQESASFGSAVALIGNGSSQANSPPPDPGVGVYFGSAVAVANGRIAVGAYRANSIEQVDSGAAYIFENGDADKGAVYVFGP